MKKIVFSILLTLPFALSAQQLFPTGCGFDQGAYDQLPHTAPLLTRSYAGLPERISMHAFCPKPGNQAPYNTCVGWSTAYGAFSIIEAMNKGKAASLEEAPSYTFSPSYIYNQIREGDDCMSPAYVHEALDKLTDQGCATLKDFPFDCDTEISTDVLNKASSYKNLISGYKILTPYKELGIDQIDVIKKSLSEQNPVVIALKCYDSFMKTGKDGIWSGVEDRYYGYHALVAVGYDDAINGGSFEIMNSWGTGWANKGFAWVKYSDFEKNCAGAYEITKNPGALTEEQANTTTDAKFPFSLKGSLKLLRDSGEPMQASYNSKAGLYVMRQAYKSGTRFRLYLTNEGPAYVYAIGFDLTGKTSMVFPYKEDMSAVLNYKNNEVAIPSETAYVQMDKNPGTDYLCVLYSKKPLDIDDIRAQIERIQEESKINAAKMEKAKKDGKGKDLKELEVLSFPETIKKVLGKSYLENNRVKFEGSGEMSFTASSQERSVLPLIVSIEHTK